MQVVQSELQLSIVVSRVMYGPLHVEVVLATVVMVPLAWFTVKSMQSASVAVLVTEVASTVILAVPPHVPPKYISAVNEPVQTPATRGSAMGTRVRIM